MLQPNVPAARRGQVTLAPRFWIVLLLTAVAAGLVGGALTLLLHLVQEVAFSYAAEPFLQGVEHAPWWRRLLVPALAGLVAGLGWWALRGPLGRRLGDAPGVSASVWSPTARPALVRTVLDGLLQTVVVAMGASLGREGAPREVAAAIGSRLSELVRLDGEQRRLVVACGAGAGLAAVYDVPLGGALFTLEVLLGSLALPLVVPAGVTSVLGALTAWLLLGDQPVYPLAVPAPDARVIVFAAVAAPLAALAAGGFVRLVGWSRRRRPTSWRLPLATVAVFTALGALAVPLPELLGNGKGPVQLVLDGAAPLGLLAVLAVLKPLLTAASLRSGANGGLFTPILATGALLGAVLGGAWSELWPGGPPGGYALVGGAAFLAAAWQAPLSAIVLVLELTRDGPGLLVPVALAALLGTLVARLVEPRSTQTVALGAAAQGPPDPLGPASRRAPDDRRIS